MPFDITYSLCPTPCNCHDSDIARRYQLPQIANKDQTFALTRRTYLEDSHTATTNFALDAVPNGPLRDQSSTARSSRSSRPTLFDGWFGNASTLVAKTDRGVARKTRMLSTCSPQSETNMMVRLSSPSQNIQYDHHPAIGEIRRTLSRSPSKNPELRHYSFRSSPARGTLPFSPSPLSPSRRSTSDNMICFSSIASPHPARLNQHSRPQRPTLRRTIQPNGVVRARTSPKSPSKRALFDMGENCNSTPMLRKRSSTEVENDDSAMEGKCEDDKENTSRHSEDGIGWKSVQTRQEKRRSGGFLMNDVPPLSPMKRSETAMNLDQPDFGSPSTKRRTVHASSGLDFSIFDSESLQNSLDEKRSQDDNDWFRTSSPLSQSRFSTIPKRSSSLRKSTLQQRQPDRLNQVKVNQLMDITSHWTDPSSTPNDKRPVRMSLDNHLQPLPRESPFSAEGKLISASIHPMFQGQGGNSSSSHPLSQTLTQSSSTPGSAQDESPTHEPIHRSDRPKSHDFSKSLPVGALRPTEGSSQSTSDFSSQESFATPAAYKSARPLPAAFMSTGLISKKNRNAEEPDAGLPKAHMPDTPCKKQSIMFDHGERANPNTIFKPRQSLGMPGTPADVTFGFARANPLPWARNSSIFGVKASKPALVRKASFASIESEEKSNHRSPSGHVDSQSTDTEYPPTPTKYAGLESFTPVPASPSPHHRTSDPMSRSQPLQSQALRFSSSKLSPIKASPESTDGVGDGVGEGSSPASLKPKSLLKVVSKPSLSFTRGRALRDLNSPTPLCRQALNSASNKPSCIVSTQLTSSPVSPHLDHIESFSPRTPSEGFLPPDPSGLSISGRGDRPTTRPGSSHLQMIPATPTGPREYFGNFSNRPSLNLNATEIADVDQTLTARFDKVDLVGTGEFSQVYRVTQPPATSPFTRSLGLMSARPSPRNSLPERVWAVKKSRFPYSGPKDRQRKVHEVDALKAMGQSDHILHFVDSWEDRSHLYIQTEFCEEGTLDVFLAHVGLKARLDDFRIWKILLELSLVGTLKLL